MLKAFGSGSRFWEQEGNEGRVDILKRMVNFGIIDTGIAWADVPKLVRVTEHPGIMASVNH